MSEKMIGGDVNHSQVKQGRSQRKHQGNILITVLILIVGILVIGAIWHFQPKVAMRPPVKPELRSVDILLAQPQPYQATIKTQGTIRPSREINLVAEVSGRVINTHDNFVEGSFFAKGQPLVTLDDRDYRYALLNAQAQIAEAERELALEKGRARQAKREWRELGSVEANALSLRKPQIKAANAALASAKAQRDRARLDVQRTKVSAPFAGRVQAAQVDLGQFVPVGSVLGVVYDRAAVEVRLPLGNDQLALASFSPGQSLDKNAPLAVELSANVGGETHRWQATVTSMDASIDSATRFYHIVAAVKEPFNTDLHGQALLVGLFVEATMLGRVIDDVIRLPKTALIERSNEKQVFVLNSENELVLKQVDIIDNDGEIVWVKSSIQAGDKIVVSDPRVLNEGIKVKENNNEITIKNNTDSEPSSQQAVVGNK